MNSLTTLSDAACLQQMENIMENQLLVENSFIGVGQLVKTGPVVSGVDGNVGVGFGISMISLPSPEILPME
jgi:hypothetical protein